MSTSVLFSALEKLTSAEPQNDGSDGNFAEKLSANLIHVKQYLKEKGFSDVNTPEHEIHDVGESSPPCFVDDFLGFSLDICTRLCRDDSGSDRFWSVKESSTLRRTLQMLVVMGILPNLNTKVGLPLHRRTSTKVKFADFEERTSSPRSFQSRNLDLRRLHSVLRRLWRLQRDNSSFANLIVGSHFCDVLVGLVQVGHEPLPAPLEDDPRQLDQFKELKAFQLESRKTIAEILDKFYPPIVFQELLLLLKLSASPPLPPPWYKRTICRLLSTLITRPNGLLHLVASFGDFFDSDAEEADKFDALAQLVATPPSAGGKRPFDVTSDYFRPVCDQLFQLLDRDAEGEEPDAASSDSSRDQRHERLAQKQRRLRLVAHCVLKIYEKYPMVAMALIVDRIVAPVLRCTRVGEGEKVILDESCFDRLVAHLAFFASQPSKLILNPESSSWIVDDLFAPIVHFLFQAFCFVKNGVSRLKKPIERVISWYLKAISTGQDDEGESSKVASLVVIFEEFLFLAPLAAPASPPSFVNGEAEVKKREGTTLADDLAFECGPNGGLIVKRRADRDDDDDDDHEDGRREPDAETVIRTIRELCEEFSCVGDFLLRMMRRMSDDVAADDAREENLQQTLNQSQSRRLDDDPDSPAAEILTLRMIDALGAEAAAPMAEMLVDDEKIVAFAQLTCRRCLMPGAAIDRETMSMTFGLISAMILGRSFERKGGAEEEESTSSSEWTSSLKSLIPVLGEVEEKVVDDAIREMAGNTLRLIEGRVDGEGGSSSASSRGCDSSSSTCDPPSKLQSALADIGDPLIPVRGHALLVLSKLIVAKDVEATARREELLGIFLANLAEEDSYVYLNAVKGLEALGLAFPDRALTALCEEFSKTSTPKTTTGGGETTFRRRLTLAESIARTCRQLGEMTPAYLPLLLNTLLGGVRDPDSYIRSSSLSALGEALEKARYAIGADRSLYEIVATLSGAAKLDAAPEVRRAAVLVIRNLLRGLGVDAIEALGGQVLKELYQLLKRVCERDMDNVVRLQAQLAYEELDALMRKFLFPEISLVKKISVLSL